ncbi:MAG: HNH endonuclease [Verrucomicrobiota bacterium]
MFHHLEHIVARSHGGSSEPSNLALACQRCKLYKGPNLTGFDPKTGEVVRLFHPRQDAWLDHFRIEELAIEGRTATGRATVHLLKINEKGRIDLRARLRTYGDFPPGDIAADSPAAGPSTTPNSTASTGMISMASCRPCARCAAVTVDPAASVRARQSDNWPVNKGPIEAPQKYMKRK